MNINKGNEKEIALPILKHICKVTVVKTPRHENS